MADPIGIYWSMRLNTLKEQMERRGFTCEVAESAHAARLLVMEEIIPVLGAKSISFGGSTSLEQSGLHQDIVEAGKAGRFTVLDTYEKSLPNSEKLELRRQALGVDLFLTGTNAVTEDGMLVNLDMIGNRVAAMMFGPVNVVVLAGRNKLVPDLQSAMDRIKEYAAPVNAVRLNKKTPCAKTGVCHDCDSPDRICNLWSIIEKPFPKGRIIVVLVNEDLGFQRGVSMIRTEGI